MEIHCFLPKQLFICINDFLSLERQHFFFDKILSSFSFCQLCLVSGWGVTFRVPVHVGLQKRASTLFAPAFARPSLHGFVGLAHPAALSVQLRPLRKRYVGTMCRMCRSLPRLSLAKWRTLGFSSWGPQLAPKVAIYEVMMTVVVTMRSGHSSYQVDTGPSPPRGHNPLGPRKDLCT